MPLIVKESSSGGDFQPLPSGLHHAVCYGLIDIGTQPSQGNFPARRKVIFLWEVPSERIDVPNQDAPGTKNMPRVISAKYTLSLHEKGNLRPMLKSWRGRDFTPEELAAFDIFQVVGANCYLNIVHKNGKGDKANRVYAEVSTVNPAPKGTPKLNPETPKILFSLDDFKGPVVIPTSIPEWIQGLIKQSDEYLLKSQKPHDPEPTQGEAQIDEDIPF